jgi:Lrp/AsnC family transcriptional regulator, leucine-responsive regulatory protein
MALDAIDRRLLAALAANGRATTTSLAALVGLSGPAVHDRLRKLESAGVIRGYAATFDPVSIGAGTAAFVSLALGPGVPDKAGIDAALAREPDVLEAHEVAGEDCYLLKVRVASPQALSALLTRLRHVGPSTTTRTTVVLRTVFERPLLAPVPAPSTPAGEERAAPGAAETAEVAG